MKNLLNFENVVKLLSGLSIAWGLYYSGKQDTALLRQEIAYIRERIDEKEKDAKIQLAELKTKEEIQAKELANIKGDIIRIFAVLPKRWYGKTEVEDEKN